MAGTIRGGKNAAETNKRKYGEDFYVRIGRIGGSKGTTGGFASKGIGKDGWTDSERASFWGQVGGSISKRRKKVTS